MVTVVFVIGLLNFGLGIGLALLLERPWKIRTPRFPRWHLPGFKKRQSASAGSTHEQRVHPLDPIPTAAAEPLVHNDFPWLPTEWADHLTAKQIAVQSFPEALFWIAYDKLHEFCGSLRKLDQPAHSATAEFPLQELRMFCSGCRTQFSKWKLAICECKQSGAHGDQLVYFTQWIQETMQHLEPTEQACEQAETSGKQEIDWELHRRNLLQTFAHLCTLSDQTTDLLAQLLRDANRFDASPKEFRIEAESMALNRLGLEMTIQEWLQKDPDRVRIASAVLVDIDHYAQHCDRHGLPVLNHVALACLKLVTEIVRREREFDRVAQYSGQSYLVFLGDTALRNAVAGAERVRQTIDAAVMKSKDGNVSITASCAVAEWNPNESFTELVGRLRLGMVEAKKAGRNCTVTCGPDETRVAQSSRLQITPHEIAI